MKITYEAEIDEEIWQGIGEVRKAINKTLEEWGLEVSDSKIETPFEVDEE
nr:hypothetical protein [uncultured Anaerosporobacter sp.]